MNIIKNIQEPLLELSEVAIIPSKQTKIHTRTLECKARMDDGKLPVFVAPMDSVINENNFDLFNKDFHAIYPRTIDFYSRVNLMQKYDDKWVAFGLKETERLIKMIDMEVIHLKGRVHICIDQANGHMEDVITFGKMLRERLVTEDSEIMVGNIANPRTITTIAYNNFADWVRIGIGGGSVCTTSVQTGVHYPMASLIAECHFYKSTFEFAGRRLLRIVADGGINDSGDICKALALGADAVMCGRLFVATEESASPWCSSSVYNEEGAPTHSMYKEYWGMSTKRAQTNMGGVGNKNSEGIIDKVLVDSTLQERTEQIESSIKSSMSYCNAHNLDEFRINSVLTRITPTAFAAYQKQIQNK
jgi:IMP dehydrogenase/GMP reductase